MEISSWFEIPGTSNPSDDLAKLLEWILYARHSCHHKGIFLLIEYFCSSIDWKYLYDPILKLQGCVVFCTSVHDWNIHQSLFIICITKGTIVLKLQTSVDPTNSLICFHFLLSILCRVVTFLYFFNIDLVYSFHTKFQQLAS